MVSSRTMLLRFFVDGLLLTLGTMEETTGEIEGLHQTVDVAVARVLMNSVNRSH